MALRLTGEFPQKLTLVGVEPESLEVNIGLTATVTRALEPALQQIIAALRQSGVTVSEREHDEVCSE